MINDQQKDHLNELINGIEKSICQIDVQYQYQMNESNRIINRLLKELRTHLHHIDLPAEQHDPFEKMVKDCQERLALLFATGQTVDEHTQSLLKDLKSRQL